MYACQTVMAGAAGGQSPRRRQTAVAQPAAQAGQRACQLAQLAAQTPQVQQADQTETLGRAAAAQQAQRWAVRTAWRLLLLGRPTWLQQLVLSTHSLPVGGLSTPAFLPSLPSAHTDPSSMLPPRVMDGVMPKTCKSPFLAVTANSTESEHNNFVPMPCRNTVLLQLSTQLIAATLREKNHRYPCQEGGKRHLRCALDQNLVPCLASRPKARRLRI